MVTSGKSRKPRDCQPHAWQRLGLLGEHRFLAFVNTVDDATKTRTENALPDIATTLLFAVESGNLTAIEASQIQADPTRENLSDLLELREKGYEALSFIATGNPPPAETFEWLQAVMTRSLGRSTLTNEASGGYGRDVEAGPDLLQARLALACDALLQSPKLSRLRECERCTALFLDIKPGPRRRYCRPTTCGNRAKVERFRSRT